MQQTIPSNKELLDVAVAAATTASNYAQEQRGRNRDANLISSQDIKLKLDVECQEIISDVILKAFPEHFILGEEDEIQNRAAASNQFEWIVDPIDGTVNFFHSNHYWCSSVAVRLNGETLAGCVSAPDLDLCFKATADGNAFCNGRQIAVSDSSSLDLSMFHTGADKNDSASKEAFRFLNAIAGSVQRVRVCGAAALDICMVASGATDGYFEPGIYIWDTAAADLVLRRAGGRGEILKSFGGHKIAYLATNGKIHRKISNILNPLI